MDAANYGEVVIILGEYLKKHNISMNFVSREANMNRTRVSMYCRNQVQRPDLDVIARICHALNCDLTDIMRYNKP